MARLQRMDLVKARNGSVLSRGLILKTDFYPSGRALDLDINLTGAPNFRTPRVPHLNVYGVAQPRVNGLKAVLSVLGCAPEKSLGSDTVYVANTSSRKCVFFSTREEPVIYISGRPFVLRDASDPTEALHLADRADTLEGIEHRLKKDILAEADKFGGLLLTHYEQAGDESIVPSWTAVDASSVLTSKELWENLRREGWGVEVIADFPASIPISPDRPIEDNYLDAYLNVISQTDPVNTSLIFSCGMGAVRTTFAMVAACIVRRHQHLALGLPDPFSIFTPASVPLAGSTSRNGTPVGGHSTASMQLEKANAQNELNKSLLRLTFLMQSNLQPNAPSHSAIELLLTQPTLLDDMSRAVRGNYGIVLSLLGCLDDGSFVKKLVDAVVDSCDHVLNLREAVLDHRLRYSLTTLDDRERAEHLLRAGKALEKYYFLLAFASYVEQKQTTGESFSQWMKARFEIWNQVVFLRKATLSVFAPVADLSTISRQSVDGRSTSEGKRKRDVELMSGGAQVLGDEWADHVVKNRSGIILRTSTLLKSDQWRKENLKFSDLIHVRGTINFRNIPGTNIYALGQPTEDAIDQVLDRVHEAHPEAQRICWINLREEPIVYVNGNPYCLRRENFSLRNMKDYGGITATRLEMLEERLKNDVTAELQAFDNKLLLHTETGSGNVVPVWEDVDVRGVADLREIMSSKRKSSGAELSYVRIPITAERPPDYADTSELIDTLMRSDSENLPIVLNCQLGRGRSTNTAVIVYLIQQWLRHHRRRSASNVPEHEEEHGYRKNPSRLPSYQIINNLLRVLRNGVRIKEEVDDAIDKCGSVSHIRESIETARKAAEQATDERTKHQLAQKGMTYLRRYFFLIIFQAYLRSAQPDTMRSFESFESYVKARPVFKTFEKELNTRDANLLKPLQRIDVEEGFATKDETDVIVANRNGAVLSASTMLKSDLFTNLQKMRVPGAPNFRRLPLVVPQFPQVVKGYEFDHGVCGSGMPTVEGMRNALDRLDASRNGHNSVFWTSLREEPVIYVAGRPHVLRTVDRPLQNVEATGITTDVVERMEITLKQDVQQELRKGGGKLLLHDEIEESPGNFRITPLFETVTEDDIMTPQDVFDLMISEGFKVDYSRVAITDEQAPLPEVFEQLIHRVELGYETATHLVFNCQMGRGRTTTGMAAASIISTVASRDVTQDPLEDDERSNTPISYDSYDGFDESAYLKGEYKTILRLVGILPYGKVAKRLCDRAVDSVEGVQNLRKAIYDYKVKVDALDKDSPKRKQIFDIACNYLYRYGALIVLTNYLIERKASTAAQEEIKTFPVWLREHREISTLLLRKTID
ncbi:hypothetical protein DL93DRAFT_2123864 [Clavulina sp. PMI_390]|nr:hypothetical protein DL93DRAFT_2123864 [Clavulina sp. PMI_390]